MIEQIKSYQKRCMKTTDHGISRSIISVSNYSIEKMFKLYCLNRKRRKEYYEAGVCANQNKKGTINQMYSRYDSSFVDREKCSFKRQVSYHVLMSQRLSYNHYSL